MLPRLRAYQREVYESPARFKVLLCGRRWGKSTVALVAALDGHGPRRGHWRGALQGARIGWVVPHDEHPAASEAWSSLEAACWEARVVGSLERRLVVLPGGGSCTLLSAHTPDTLRGLYLDGVIVDECSIQDRRVWSALRPTLSDYGGWAILAGTVPEQIAGHWFVELYGWCQQPAALERGWQAWRRPTRDNPQISEADLEEARTTLGTRVYLREYEAELLQREGGVFREEWFSRRWGPALPEGITRLVITLDAAWRTGVRNDYSSAQFWARAGQDLYLLDELHGRWESPELRRQVSAFRARWLGEAEARGLALPVVVESAGGGQVALQELRASVDYPVLEHSVSRSSKMSRSEAVSPLVESGRVVLPEERYAPWVRHWLDELVGFPELAHDDRVDAATMALEVLSRSPEPARVVLPPVPPARPLASVGYA